MTRPHSAACLFVFVCVFRCVYSRVKGVSARNFLGWGEGVIPWIAAGLRTTFAL